MRDWYPEDGLLIEQDIRQWVGSKVNSKAYVMTQTDAELRRRNSERLSEIQPVPEAVRERHEFQQIELAIRWWLELRALELQSDGGSSADLAGPPLLTGAISMKQ